MSVVRGEHMRLYDPVKVDSENTHLSRLNTVLGVAMLFALLGLIMTGIYYYSQPSTLPIKKVQVEGDFRNLSTSRLQTLVTEEVTGGFFTVNVAEVRNKLLEAPWVEHVSVNRIWPDTLRVFVKERVAVVRWGELGLLNAEAMHFVPPPATIPHDLPVLNGPEGSYRLMLERFNELQNILEHMNLKLMTLTMNERRAWSFTVHTGFEVVIGRMDYEKRIKRFSEVVVKAMASRLQQVKKVDMRYTNGFAIEWINEVPATAGVNLNG